MADSLVANAQIPVPWGDKDPHPDDPTLSRLRQNVLQPGDPFDPKDFTPEDVAKFKEGGAVVPKSEFVSDDERATSLSLSGMDAYRAGKKAAYAEEHPDATEEEIDKQGNVIPPDTTVRGSEPSARSKTEG